MTYEVELAFLQNVMKKLRVGLRISNQDQVSVKSIYSDLTAMELEGSSYERLLQDYLRTIQHRTVYRMRDPYEFCYMFFLLPECEHDTVAVLGPYLDRNFSHEELLELGERMGLSPRVLRLLEQEIALVPVFREDGMLYSVLEAFADRIWGGSETYTMVDLNREISDPGRMENKTVSDDPEEILLRMKMHEQRYASENDMMYAVSHGLTHRVEIMFSHFNQLLLDKRMADPIRDIKNYAIVMNTLMRKAAEQGGVHPLYLDEMSSSFSRRIEQLSSVESVIDLMTQIGPGYCRLVRKHALINYSQLVQRIVSVIDADLTADLSLHTLAQNFSVSSAYLSALFKKETGLTLTEYVNRARMELAVRLLGSTKLQVQTIAQHCGMLDVNYFSKLFRKHVGLSPTEWRRTTLLHKPI